MPNKPRDMTALAILEDGRNLFRLMAEKYGGDCTLNELRVMNQIVYGSFEERTCCVTDLHKVTGIPMPTVSRSVGHLRNNGWLSDKRDPSDGRKRIISLNPRALEQTGREIRDAVQWFNDFRAHGVPDTPPGALLEPASTHEMTFLPWKNRV